MTAKHTRTLGPKITADHRLLNHLKARPVGTVGDIVPGSTTVWVEGGLLASSCEEDHEEVLGCWKFYRERPKPD